MPRESKCFDGADRRKEHRSGTDSASVAPLVGLSIPASQTRPAGNPGHCFSVAGKGHLRQWLLLARTRLSHWTTAEIEAGVLGT